jgi:glycosyltransferase involved in cell wall biosynthesis
MAPRVTVIVTSFNYAQFLHQRLESICEQTFTDFEVLFLDDASQDESLDVLASVMDHYPNVAWRSMVNTVNSGNPFAQWNRGVAEARGELVWIAEADDFADPMFLARMVDLLDNHPKVGIAYCQSTHVDEDGNDLGSIIWSVDWLGRVRWEQPFVADGVTEVREVLVLQNTIPNASGVVFRRHVFQAVGGAVTHLRLMGDWLTWGRMLMHCDLAFDPRIMNHFRVHPRSLRHQHDNTEHLQYVSQTYRVGLALARLSGASPAQKRRMLTHYARIVRARLINTPGWPLRLRLLALAWMRDAWFPWRLWRVRRS